MRANMKLALTLLMGVIFSYQAHSQAFFGINGGINTAGLTLENWKTNLDPGDKEPVIDNVLRSTFGVHCELPLSKYVILQPELYWAAKGANMRIDSATGDIFGAGLTTYSTTNNLSMHYIQLPILIKFRMQLTNPKPLYPREGTGRPLFFEFYLGPVVNYMLMASANYATVSEHTPAGASEPEPKITTSGKVAQAGLSPIDFSLALGGNLMYKINRKTHLYLGARYSLNFMDINNGMFVNEYLNSEGNPVTSSPTLKNSGNLAVTIGIATTFTKRRYWNHPRMNNRKF